MKWYKMAADGGYSHAQHRLGMAYEFGELALAIDLEAARTWYHEAAEGGDEEEDEEEEEEQEEEEEEEEGEWE